MQQRPRIPESLEVTYGGAVRRAFTELSRVGAAQVARLAGDWRASIRQRPREPGGFGGMGGILFFFRVEIARVKGVKGGGRDPGSLSLGWLMSLFDRGGKRGLAESGWSSGWSCTRVVPVGPMARWRG